MALQQLVRPSLAGLTVSLSSTSLSSPSIRVPSAVISSNRSTSSSSRLSTPLSAQRQLKFHASSSSPTSLSPHHSAHSLSMASASSFLLSPPGGREGPSSPSSSSASLASAVPQLPQLQAALQANARDESVSIALYGIPHFSIASLLHCPLADFAHSTLLSALSLSFFRLLRGMVDEKEEDASDKGSTH